MDNNLTLFIIIWTIFSITIISNNNNLFDNIIHLFIFINIILLLISLISFIQTKRNLEFEKKQNELIIHIYKNNNISKEKLDELLKINNSLNIKRLSIRIEDKLIQMKEKELNNAIMYNLRKNKNNITKEQIKIILIGQKQKLDNYKYEIKSLILLLNL
jgi:Glu-tRNA(Gln) amidotransferase subunit E-like FAD-binding protein